MKYRPFLSLSNEEIEFIIKEIFPNTPRVDNIVRNEKTETISCDIYIMEEYPDFADTLDLTVPSIRDPEGITTHDFALDSEELWIWQQYLLAKGCDRRLENNPYLEEELDKEAER